MLRGSVEGVIGGSFNSGTGRSSVDEDEKAADDVNIKHVKKAVQGTKYSIGLCSNDQSSHYGRM